MTEVRCVKREKRNVLSLDLKTATESLLRTVFGSEFKTAGAEDRKACFANVIVVEGSHSVIVVDRRLWPCSLSWIRRRDKIV